MTHQLLLLLKLALLAVTCEAYTPPATFVIQEMAIKYAAPRASGYALSGMVSSSNNPQKAAHVHFTLDDHGLSQSVAPAEKPERVNLHILDLLWGCQKQEAKECAKRLVDYLHNANIDTSKIGVAIFDTEPVYVIGDKNSPQLWINKALLVPVKEKVADKENTFEKWVSSSKNAFLYPRIINLKNGSTSTNIAMAEKVDG